MNKFNPGDRVICIKNTEGYEHKLDLNNVYIVSEPYHNSPYFIYLDNDNSKTYKVDRFELAYIKEFNDKLNNLIE